MSVARTFLATLLGGVASIAQALVVAPYSAEALAQAQNTGAPVVLHFHASWCPVCRTQDRVLDELKADPALTLTVLQADYDVETELKKQLKVRSQSTMIFYRGSRELGRLYGEMQPPNLKGAFEETQRAPAP